MHSVTPIYLPHAEWSLITPHLEHVAHADQISRMVLSFADEWSKLFGDNYNTAIAPVSIRCKVETGELRVNTDASVPGMLLTMRLYDANPKRYYCAVTRFIGLYLDQHGKINHVKQFSNPPLFRKV